GNDRDKRPSNRPWGEQRPSEGGQKRPGQQGEQMPEIEELMKKGQERLRVLMGGRGGGNGRNGGGGGGPSGPGFGLGFNKTTVAIAALVGIVAWGFVSFYRVETNENSVEFLFGRAVAV